MPRGRDCHDCAYFSRILDIDLGLRGRFAALYDAALLLLIFIRDVLFDIIIYQQNRPYYM